MAFLSCFMLLYVVCSFLSQSSSLATAGGFAKPNQVVLPIYKDPSTLQYLIQIKQRTPLVPVRLTIDLGGRALWTDCENGYNSTTISPAGCHTTQCRLAQASENCLQCTWGPIGPGCTDTKTCWRFPQNTVTRTTSSGEVALDIIAIESKDGKGQANVVTVPQFLFICASTTNAHGLAKGVTGMAGLGRTNISLPVQLATVLNLRRIFGLCLSSSTASNSSGVVIFGNGPYNFFTDDSTNAYVLVTHTSLIINKVNAEDDDVFRGESSPEYFIGVRSIKINDITVELNSTLLKINDRGFGGTKISTVNPYTVLETSIYNAVIEVFTNELKNVTRVPAVAPFGACFSSKNIVDTPVGPAVPTIDLVMEEKGVTWTMFGANSMVRVNKDVLCLGFVDGGEPTYITSIVIGGHQIQETLLRFDHERSRLGFSSSLLLKSTRCANYRAMSNA